MSENQQLIALEVLRGGAKRVVKSGGPEAEEARTLLAQLDEIDKLMEDGPPITGLDVISDAIDAEMKLYAVDK